MFHLGQVEHQLGRSLLYDRFDLCFGNRQTGTSDEPPLQRYDDDATFGLDHFRFELHTPCLVSYPRASNFSIVGQRVIASTAQFSRFLHSCPLIQAPQNAKYLLIPMGRRLWTVRTLATATFI